MSRDYYNRRIGANGSPPRLTLAEAANQVAAAYRFLDQQGYLQESFGYYCVDDQDVAGLHGTDLRQMFYLQTGIRIKGSVPDFMMGADEVALFTICEFVHDHVSKPAKDTGRFHSFSNCGWHYDFRQDRFDRKAGRDEWRTKLNAFLKFYEDGFYLSAEGEVTRVAPDGTAALVKTPLPPRVADKDRAKVANALHTFQLGRATREQRQQACVTLSTSWSSTATP